MAEKMGTPQFGQEAKKQSEQMTGMTLTAGPVDRVLVELLSSMQARVDHSISELRGVRPHQRGLG